MAIEASHDDELASIKLPHDRYSEVDLSHHVRLLAEAGLIHAVENHRVNAGVSWLPHALTWKSHDFLASVSDAAVWEHLVAQRYTVQPFALLSAAADGPCYARSLDDRTLWQAQQTQTVALACVINR